MHIRANIVVPVFSRHVVARNYDRPTPADVLQSLSLLGIEIESSD
jgi:hypothetical protein